MPKQNESPYVSHVFVCTNDRGGERKSCADNNSQLIKSKLKDAVNGSFTLRRYGFPKFSLMMWMKSCLPLNVSWQMIDSIH
jgi:hypothetical protein